MMYHLEMLVDRWSKLLGDRLLAGILLFRICLLKRYRECAFFVHLTVPFVSRS